MTNLEQAFLKVKALGLTHEQYRDVITILADHGMAESQDAHDNAMKALTK